jgi:acetyl-CoA carboxylase biotin carboxylase subunit
MIAKIIATASTRQAAINRMNRALGEYLLEGIKTTISLQRSIMCDVEFRRGNYHTGFLERFLEHGVPVLKD